MPAAASLGEVGEAGDALAGTASSFLDLLDDDLDLSTVCFALQSSKKTLMDRVEPRTEVVCQAVDSLLQTSLGDECEGCLTAW
jgi:hypothetical protein